MKRTLLLSIFLAYSSIVWAQKTKKPTTEKNIRQPLIGTWSLVSVDNVYPDSSRVHPYDENPQGLLIIDAKGRYALQILKAVRPKVASGNKDQATAEENAALVKGSNSHFGTYVCDEKSKTLTFFIEHASFPNWEGTQQKRFYTLSGDLLKYVVTNTTQGGSSVVAEVVWKKID